MHPGAWPCAKQDAQDTRRGAARRRPPALRGGRYGTAPQKASISSAITLSAPPTMASRTDVARLRMWSA